jgi:5,10-methylenetetrahydrofolate reductase
VQDEERSTALIRDVLVHWLMLRWIQQEASAMARSSLGQICLEAVLEPLGRSILQQVQQGKRRLRQSGTRILTQRISKTDIVIEYKENQYTHEAIYPIPILFADAKERILQRLREGVRL